jgi:hypothetical protein
MSLLRNGILVVIALVCAVLFALPASAAPPLHRVTCGGWGVSGDSTWETTDIVGDTVHFTCAGIQTADGTWRGEGTFRGNLDGAPITVHLDVDNGLVFGTTSPWRVAALWGDAEVSYRGSTSTEHFSMTFAQDSRTRPNLIGGTVMTLQRPGTDEYLSWWVAEGYGGFIRGGAITID